jgi:ParB family transcriptional regulator, chromosome partitioning protein
MTAPSKGLGRGLQTLLNPQPRNLYRAGALPVSAIRQGSHQPRSHIREEPLEELAASIKANGVIQPIVVRPVPDFPHQFEIVAGERRWQAAKLAGLTEIPAVVRELTDQEALALALIENIQREELTPPEEARALRRLAGEFSLTHERVAEVVGRSRAAVSNLIRLLDLPDTVLALIDANKISMGHARALLGLEHKADREQFAHQVVDRALSVRQTEELVRKGPNALEGTAHQRSAKPSVSEVLKTAFVHVRLTQKKNRTSRLIVEVKDPDRLEPILDAIKRAAE